MDEKWCSLNKRIDSVAVDSKLKAQNVRIRAAAFSAKQKVIWNVKQWGSYN